MQDAARLLERVLGTGPAPGSNKGHLELGAEQVVVLGRVHLRQQARRVRRRVHAGVRHKQVDEVRRHGVGQFIITALRPLSASSTSAALISIWVTARKR